MIIYKVTNKINGKVYIGKTKYTLNDRKSQHFSECKYYICQYTLEGELLHIFSTRKELLEKFGKEPPRFINDSCKYLNFNWKRFRKNEITKEEIFEL